MKRLLILPAIWLLVHGFQACKKNEVEPEPTPPITDSKLWGHWQVDSAIAIQGGRVRSHMMDTLHGLPTNTTARIIVQLTEDFKAVADAGYHYAIDGSYKLTGKTTIDIQVEEIEDRANRPKSDWQPMVVSALNDADTYRVEGDGSRGSQLLLYYAHGGAILRCTKL